MLENWDLDGAEREGGSFAGRDCVTLATTQGSAALAHEPGVELQDGVIEADVAIEGQRSFHGLFWRLRPDTVTFENFYVRPHQSGNDDALQYTPVFNAVTAWQLHHGDGFWNAVPIPNGEWFTIRAAFEGNALAVDLNGERVLDSRLRTPVVAGPAGLYVAGPRLHVARFEARAAVSLGLAAPADAEPPPGVLREWEVSDPAAEGAGPADARGWQPFEPEPSGLLNLARLHGIEDGRNTVFARTWVGADADGRVLVAFGFSDRVRVYANGVPLFRGDAGYRTRDYRFLGSIGWYEAIDVPLNARRNELVFAVSEDFGGWGVQARVTQPGEAL